jgi:hypothetical protein
MAIKILNVDKIKEKPAAEVRCLQIDGVEHPILETTVGMFLDTNAEAERLKGEANLGVQLNSTIDTILRFVPTLKREQLLSYTLETLGEIASFVSGNEIEEEQATEAAQLAQEAGAAGEAGK